MIQKFSQAPFMLTLAGARKGDPRISAFPPNSLMSFLRLKPPNCWHTAPFLTINCPKCYCFRYLCKMKEKKKQKKIQSRLIHFMVSWVSKGQVILKCPFGVIISTKIQKKTFLWISAVAIKKRLDQKLKKIFAQGLFLT